MLCGNGDFEADLPDFFGGLINTFCDGSNNTPFTTCWHSSNNQVLDPWWSNDSIIEDPNTGPIDFGQCWFHPAGTSPSILGRFDIILGFNMGANETWDGCNSNTTDNNHHYAWLAQGSGFAALDVPGTNPCDSIFFSFEGFNEGMAQSVGQLTAGNTYTLEYYVAYQDFFLPDNYDPTLRVFLEPDQNFCAHLGTTIFNGATWTDGTFAPDQNAIVMNHTITDNIPLFWFHVVETFTPTVTATYSLYFSTNNDNIANTNDNETFSQVHFFVDDVSVVDVTSEPISYESIILPSLEVEQSIMVGEEFTVQFTVCSDIGMNSSPITLNLNFPDGNAFNILGGDFDNNFQLTIAPSDLSDCHVYTAVLALNNTAVLGTNYRIGLIVNNNSVSGCLSGNYFVCVEAQCAELNAQIFDDCPTGIFIDLSVEGGVQPYTYQWVDGFNQIIGNTQDITVTAGSTFAVLQFNDANGCQISEVYIFDPQPVPDFPLPLTITGTTVWVGEEFTFGDDLIIAPGASLNAINCDLRFDAGSRVLIQSASGQIAGELSASYTTFNSLCPSVWEGIQVTGASTTSYGGRGTIKLDWCEIENARNGLSNHQINNGNLVAGTTGGYMKIDRTLFKNNIRDVNFESYGFVFNGVGQADGSEFRQCSFLINSAFFQNLMPIERMYLHRVRSIGIYGCALINTNPAFLTNNMLFGIRSEIASFRLLGCFAEPMCPSIVSGFTYGVRMDGGVAEPFPTMIDRMTFNCHRGVFCNAGISSYIWRSTFDDLPTGFPNNPMGGFEIGGSYGVYFMNGQAYNINECLFTHDNASFRYGAVINNTGIMNNLTYRSTFEGLSAGLVYYFDNRSTGGGTGSQYMCSDFIANGRDVSVQAIMSQSSMRGVRQNMGTPQVSAGCNFTYTSAQFDDLSNTAGTSHQYYFHPIEDEPIDNLNYLTIQSPFFNDCFSNIPIAGGWQQMALFESGGLEGITQIDLQIDELQNSLIQIVDGGNTPALTSEVISTTYSEALTTYYNLIAQSPNISESVLIEAIRKEYDLPAVLLTSILQSNPIAAKSDEIQKEIENRIMPLEDYQKQMIAEGLNWLSEMEELRAEISRLRSERSTLLRNLVLLEWDSENIDHEQILSYLNEEKYPEDRLMRIEVLRSLDLIDESDILISDYSIDYALPTGELSDVETWITLKDIDNSLSLSEDFSSLEICNTALSEQLPYSSGLAQALLVENDQLWIQEPIFPFEEVEPRLLVQAKSKNDFELIPNPGNTYTVVHSIAANPIKSIEVYSSNGNLLCNIVDIKPSGDYVIDTSAWTAGVYIFKVKDEIGGTVELKYIKL